jgi:ABC-type branched-subunit amino acid transport system ATPase component
VPESPASAQDQGRSSIFDIIRDINRLGHAIPLVEQNARMTPRVAHRG